MVRHRVRVRFAKRGQLRFVGHRDLIRAMERLFRRAQLRLGMSEGFHPKPRMTFPSALALGIEGMDEVMELELAEELSGDEVLARLQEHAIEGLEFLFVEVLPQGAKKARVTATVYEAPIPHNMRATVDERIRRLLEQSECLVARPRDGKEFDLRPSIRSLTLQEGVARIEIRQLDSGITATPRDVLRAMDFGDLADGRMTRVRVEIANGG